MVSQKPFQQSDRSAIWYVRGTMQKPAPLTLINAMIADDHVAIPHGMVPVYMHSVNGRMMVYVKNWSAEKEDEANEWDLYPVRTLRRISQTQFDGGLLFSLTLERYDEDVKQDWFDGFSNPTKIARIGENSCLRIVDTDNGLKPEDNGGLPNMKTVEEFRRYHQEWSDEDDTWGTTIELTDNYAIREIGYKSGSALKVYTICLRRTDEMFGVLAESLDEAKRGALNNAIVSMV
jgi:hypothetical protein